MSPNLCPLCGTLFRFGLPHGIALRVCALLLAFAAPVVLRFHGTTFISTAALLLVPAILLANFVLILLMPPKLVERKQKHEVLTLFPM